MNARASRHRRTTDHPRHALVSRPHRDRVRPAATTPATASTHFEPELIAPHQAREFTRDALHDWQVDDLDIDAQLVVSELVTRTVTAGSAGTLMLRLDPDGVHVEVTADQPVVARSDEEELDVQVIEGTSDRWGNDYTWPHFRLTWSDLPR